MFDEQCSACARYNALERAERDVAIVVGADEIEHGAAEQFSLGASGRVVMQSMTMKVSLCRPIEAMNGTSQELATGSGLANHQESAARAAREQPAGRHGAFPSI